MRRRARRTARPPRVDIRARKPCLRARFRLLGWNVRFITDSLGDRSNPVGQTGISRPNGHGLLGSVQTMLSGPDRVCRDDRPGSTRAQGRRSGGGHPGVDDQALTSGAGSARSTPKGPNRALSRLGDGFRLTNQLFHRSRCGLRGSLLASELAQFRPTRTPSLITAAGSAAGCPYRCGQCCGMWGERLVGDRWIPRTKSGPKPQASSGKWWPTASGSPRFPR